MIETTLIVSITLLLLLGYLFVREKRKRAEAEFYKLLAENIPDELPDIITVVNRDFKILRVANSKPESCIFPERTTAGNYLTEVMDYDIFVDLGNEQRKDPTNHAPMFKGIKQAFETGKIVEMHYEIVINKKRIYMEGRYKQIAENEVLCIERNNTKQKEEALKLQQNNQLLDQIIENLPIPVYIKDVDDDFRYVYWNKQCQTLGLTPEDMIGKTDFDVFDHEQATEYRKKDLIAKEKGYLSVPKDRYEDGTGRKSLAVLHKKIINDGKHNWLLNARWDISELIATQERLKEANQQLRMALDVTSAVPLIWDIENDIIRLRFNDFKGRNPGFKTDRDGVPSTAIPQYVHPEEREEKAEALKKLRTGETDTLHTVVRYDARGIYESYYEALLTITKRNKHGLPTQAIGTLRNITNSKHREQKLLKAHQDMANLQSMNQVILDNSNSGLVFITPDGEVKWENITKYSNHQFTQLFKVGNICFDKTPHENENETLTAIRNVFETQQKQFKELTCEDGTILDVTATPVKDRDGKCHGAVLKFDNVTTQRKAANELRLAKEAAEASDRLKSQFISNMSHEIRTPLNSIVGFSELLMTAKTPEEQHEFMAVIKNNNEQLLQLINDIIDLSKIEANILEFEYSNVDINEVINTVVHNNSRRIETGKNLGIHFNAPAKKCTIMTERNRIRQVINNLVTNAVKFTKEGIVEVGYEIRPNHMYFYVKDTGVGIPKDKQEVIFERFVKLNNFIAGTGLGLSVCRSVVHKMGGEIGVESEPEQGATFWFTLPVQPGTDMNENLTITQKRKLRDRTLGSDGQMRKPVLLVAEDSPEIYRIYKNNLQAEYELIHAWDGKETIELYEKHKTEIDVILMDIKMPVINGFEATDIIRKTDLDIPIIAISAYVSPEDLERIINSGFDNFIPKPVSKEDLFAVIKALV